MGELEAAERELEHFASSARSGRRNALPEIEVESNDPDAAQLAERLSDMTAKCEGEEERKKQQQEQSHPKERKS
ncbi:unnamed protein product [Caenorhabditis auriculariae]|uniref:Uncharacterized protein n=1 Tax=Caenorhabditis auriculariae TaxID=2777116 RepID=A0A8S1H1C6_9PELO|nr:unnamed protein product [Caenorhabditis auriculariae]